MVCILALLGNCFGYFSKNWAIFVPNHLVTLNPSLPNFFYHFSPSRCQWQDLNPRSWGCEASHLPLCNEEPTPPSSNFVERKLQGK